MAKSIKSSQNKKAVDVFRSSVILSAIDRFSKKIYSWLKTGLFGTVFSAYSDPAPAARREGRISRYIITPMRRMVSRRLDECCTVNLVRRLTDFLLRCRLRVYGTFLLTFGIYAAATFVLALLGTNLAHSLTDIAVALCCIGASIPLLLSDLSLSEAMLNSTLAMRLASLLGIRRESLRADGRAGRTNLAFIAGMILGSLTLFVPTLYVAGAGVGLILAYRIFATPELGVLILFFAMPFLPTMILVALICYTALCFGAKLLLGKREFHLLPVDAAAVAFAICLAFAGVFSFSAGSRKPALVLICFLLGYILTASLIRTREWLKRCTWAAVTAASLVSLYGIYQYFFGSLDADTWLDSSMFEDISARVVSTLENPNMLAEYLILLFPIAAALLVTRGNASQKGFSLCACALCGLCIILTWSRGAWLGLLFAGVIFLLVWNHRTMYLMLAGVAAIPFLPLVLPSSIVSRFTSIGNLADTSTSYRVNIWRGTVRMLRDYWGCGIGIGESAWDTVYPRYSLAAIETAPHSHNLYLQITVECGIVGLLVFLVFIFLLMRYNFTYYRRLEDMRQSIASSIRPDGIALAGQNASRKLESAAISRITKLRMEAAAPLCGILAVLVQSFTDYTWYNYRVYLMFWLIAGLSAAYVRCGQADLSRLHEKDNSPLVGKTEANLDLPLCVPEVSKSKKGDSRYA
ncbi:MAG: O-antigen ligase family protein [Clostridia bacterium]|nr:O-antigen ligase family protein [Clostridia bacterium]